MDTETIKTAVRQAMDAGLLGIEQIEAELTEDGKTVLLYGHTADPDRTYTASVEVPANLVWRLA